MFDYPDQAKQFKEMSDATTFTKSEKPPGVFKFINFNIFSKDKSRTEDISRYIKVKETSIGRNSD